MKRKDLIEFGNLYIKLDKISKTILKKIKPSSISEGVSISCLLSQKFYYKHDYLQIINLCKKHKVNYSTFEKLKTKYLTKEKEINKLKNELKTFGVENVSIGPNSIYGEMGKLHILIKIYPTKKSISISVYHEGIKDSPLERKELKKKIKSIIY